MTIDQSIRAFNKYKDQITSFLEIDMSESDTRSKVIDNILIKVLGWAEEDITREGHSDAGFFDYRVAANNFNFVIEAKRNFIEFDLPNNHKTTSLNALYKGNKEIINQIRSYAMEEGLQYGFFTNGKQFVISKLVNVNGTKWKKNKCVIFDGLDSIENRFIEFYNLISKKSVTEQGGFHYQPEMSKSGNKIINYLSDKNEELIRNSISSSLIPTIERVFGEMFKYSDLDDRELIEECYVYNNETKKNKSDIERLFGDLPPAYEEVIPIVNTKNQINQISSEITDYPTTIKDTPPPNPIVIIGSKGAGKTTFLNYLFKVGLNKEDLKDYPSIYLDFRKFSDDHLSNRTDQIFKSLIEGIYEKYNSMDLFTIKVLKRVFRQEIKYNDKGIWEYSKNNNPSEYQSKLAEFIEQKTKDYENHFVKLSEYLLRERRKRLIVIIDNVDQFNITIQKKAYVFAHSMNMTARCAVLISLREGYYYKFRHETPFNAYESNVYHVTAAKYSTVLLRRINFAIRKLSVEEENSDSSSSLPNLSKNDAIVNYLRLIKSVLFESSNTEMLDFLEKTTYPNLREGLLLFKKFLLSGHAKAEEYIERQSTNIDPSTAIPIWEFVAAIALENKKYYNNDISIIKNIFYPSSANTSHFTKIKILKYLLNAKSYSSKSDKYVLLDEIQKVFLSLGVSNKIFIDEVTELVSWGMVETESSIEDTESENIFKEISSQSLTISLKGFYYVNVLKNKFHYLDLVLQDTPIFDDNSYMLLTTNFPKSDVNGKINLRGRSLVVRQFHDYLTEKEKTENNGDYNIFRGITQEMKDQGMKEDMKRIGFNIKAGK